jgi:hypothetical protein
MDWETLPIERDQNSYDGYDDDDYNDWGFWGGGGVSQSNSKEYVSDNSNWSTDYFTHVYLNGKEKKVYIHKKQIEIEKKMIHGWLSNQIDSFDFVEVIWNGHSLYSESASGRIEYVGSRSDLIENLPDLKTIPKDSISETIKLVEKKIEKKVDYGFDFDDMY